MFSRVTLQKAKGTNKHPPRPDTTVPTEDKFVRSGASQATSARILSFPLWDNDTPLTHTFFFPKPQLL